MAHIDRIKRRARHLGMPKGVPHAWYYRMPWVLVAAALMVLLVYVITLCAVVRGGSVCLNSFPGFLSGASAGVRPPREAAAG